MQDKRIILTLACLILLSRLPSLPASAGPARPGVLRVTGADGAAINVRVFGDEFFHYITTEDGYLLIDGGDGLWYFAAADAGGGIISSGIRAKSTACLSAAERSRICKGLKPEAPAAGRFGMARVPGAAPSLTRADEAGGLSAPPSAAGTSWKALGSKKILVLMAQFSDVPFSSGAKSAFEDLLNSRDYTAGGATGSVWQYFHDNSGGSFDPEFTVAGPYTLSKPRASYSDNAEAMIREVAALADADIDFGGYSEGGTVRDIFVYYSGGAKSDAVADAIWPHRSLLTSGIRLDNNLLQGYACSSELEVSDSGESQAFATIGSFCHEFGHILGWPDLYDNNSANGSADGPRFFSLMDIGCYNNGGKTPPALGILERWMAGWSTPEILSEAGPATLLPAADGHGYLIRTESDSEYFLLECRGTGKTVWDKAEYLDYYGTGKAWGLLVGHTDISGTSGWKNYAPNDIPGKEGYSLLYSDKTSVGGLAAAYCPTHCFFPGGSGVTDIRSDAATGLISRDGRRTAMEISGIAPDEASGTVSLTLSQPGADISDAMTILSEHDAVISWSDDISASWTVSWQRADGGEAKSVKTDTPEVHLQALEAGREYQISITSDRSGRPVTLSVTTEGRASGLPRISLSQLAAGSGERRLLSLCGCDDYTEIQWHIDGAEADSYTTLAKGEHYIQAVITMADGSRNYFARYVNVLF